MHVVVASSAFDVSFRQFTRFAPGRIAALARESTAFLPTIGRVLGVTAQGLMFAAAMWLLLAAPGLLSVQEGPVRMEAARQASR